MFGSMRGFYGCWPWEYRKTWYSAGKEIARLDALIGLSRPSDRPELANTEETQTTPDPLADAVRAKIAESLREMIAESRSEAQSSEDALRADSENEYSKRSMRVGR